MPTRLGSHALVMVQTHLENANKSLSTIEIRLGSSGTDPDPVPEADCPADTNNDGQVTPADFGAWITNDNAGC